MFSRVSFQVGFYMCVGSWLVLEILHLRAAIQNHTLARNACEERPPPWGMVTGILAVVVFAVVAWQSEPDGFFELSLGISEGILVAVPLVVLARLLAVWFRSSHRVAVVSTGFE